jgi:hypothetical protein
MDNLRFAFCRLVLDVIQSVDLGRDTQVVVAGLCFEAMDCLQVAGGEG